MMKNTISRRNFLKGAAVAGGAVTLAGLAGCSSEPTQANADSADWMPVWDYEADIIAVGAGAGGLASAKEGSDAGLEVILLESQSNVGGNSAICNGGISMAGTPLQKELGYEDSPELMFDDLMGTTGVDQNENFVKLISENNLLLWDWLTGMGIKFEKEGLVGTVGQSVPREHHTPAGEVINTLKKAAQDGGAQIMVSTPARHLIQDPTTKRVIGVEAEDKSGNTIYLKARKAVLMTTGGYARNTEMLNKWIFGTGAEAFAEWTFDAIGQDGSGILMGMEIGAVPRHIDYSTMFTGQNPDGQIGQACAMFHVGALLINKEGERFVNEQLGYGNVWPDLNKQTDKICFQVWDDPIAQDHLVNDSSYYSMEKIEKSGLLLKADTLEELAALMGMPADALVETINTYNSDVESTGRDSKFGREHLVSTQGTPLPIKAAPFYGYKTTNAIMTTFGGLEQDDTCRAVDVFGNSIEGLYLAGNISGYCNFGIDPGTRYGFDTSGTGFGGAMAFGRYCVHQIEGLENWEA